jgi:ELWxxDGT repeat protein
MKKLFTVLILVFALQVSHSQSKFVTTFATDTYGGPSASVAAGNKLFFSACDAVNGRELWCTDGTTAGTYMVKDINPGTANSIAAYFEYTAYGLNGILYFKADDGLTGAELWRSDGTAAGTYLLKDLTPGMTGGAFGEFASVNNTLYFTGGIGTQLWRSDGTAAGTYVVESFNVISNLYGWNGNLYFAGDQSNSGEELWKSNGTAAGTNLLKDLNGTFGASLPINFHGTPGALYFMANDNSGWELWKTTGTNAGTVRVTDINTNGNSVLDAYAEAEMANLGDTVYFRAWDSTYVPQLYRTDGTSAGTAKCTSLPNSIYSSCTFPIVNGKVLVNNYIVNNFWQYDPATDTATLTGYPSFFYINGPGKFIFVDDKMILVAKDTLYGCEVWKSQGTAQSTGLVQESHLTDNWYNYPSQGFNSILGKLGNTVLYTNARTPYTYEVLLMSYDATQGDSCFAPTVIVPVPATDTSAHFVWNRITDDAQYEFRYRLSGASIWNTVASDKSYVFINSFDSAADYEYQVRATCNAITSGWSDLATYNSGFISDAYLVNILADRTENDSTERIYWLCSNFISYIQLKYRVYGTTAYTTVSSYNGYKRITGLQSNTLYEYLVRLNYNGVFGQWTTTPLYFYVTPSLTTTTATIFSQNDRIKVFPVPSQQFVLIEGLPEGKTEFELRDFSGRLLKSGEVKGNRINLEGLTNGVYILKLKSKAGISVNKIVKG